MTFFIGVDGGGTKTEVITLNSDGEVLVTLTGPSTNARAVGFPRAWAHLQELLDSLLNHPALGKSRCAGLCLGLAGVDLPEERQSFLQALEGYFQQRGENLPITITNDAEIVLMASLSQKYGIVAVSGTGSILYGLTPEGNRWRIGGWGHLLGDEGSGYAIGLKTLQTVMKSYDGMLPPTLLTDLITEAYSFGSITELKSYIYQPDIKKQHIAEFARYCIQAGIQEDAAADRILRDAAGHLVRQTTTLIGKDPWFASCELVEAGSVFKHSSVFAETFRQHLNEAYPDIRCYPSKRSPAYGAALQAMQR
ncbi:BadF/BadG/BcrA/BcrD ATPase family protein [Paenibacillus sp. J2TS4]|uniref:BadF/BadG/BcrA/BcrD ATPase family protein n=1 Tax=Paenibacillus sp. J2TS4 TaxID=2807194 RepID=UPI001B14A7F1|nr:BadF/BadG/BcrA/BcrD ATPase family protein [Paenibacillus sp. J2TS4]GIP34352.1 N-acetylmuramic acid/N-acetylglucosamine kinase [Paenibacillus sp. J2TS4]